MRVILCKMGEMVLKGLNRARFETALLNDLQAKLRPCGAFSISARQSAVFVEPCEPDESYDWDAVRTATRRVFGLVNFSFALKCPKEPDALRAAALSLPGLDKLQSFKVEARRSDKRFVLTSPQICADLGQAVLERYPALRVDVHKPEQVLWAEIRDDAAYVHLGAEEAAGGLPPGTAGKAVLLLSGGIDSPVAGWRMARRGLSLLPLHFTSYPYTSPEARDKVLRLAELLACWCGPTTLRLASLTKIQEAIRRYAPEDLATVLARRSMVRIAARAAERLGAGAVITGDALGQVASQTLEALSVTEQASALPLLRPLVGMDKEEVVRTARRIGTFETSILPYEDCCGLFTPKHPRTRPRLQEVLAAEQTYDYRTLEAESVQDITKHEIYG